VCGRYSITLPPEAIREIFQTHGGLPNWPAYYNAPPTTALPVVRQAKDGSGRELVLMQWGLIPWFSKDGKPSYSTINARAEGVQTAASFREPFKNGRRSEERSTAALLHARQWSADGACWPVESMA
jgi:putative SOS response-associated peptidase YedK